MRAKTSAVWDGVLPAAVDDLWKAGAEEAVMIDACFSRVLEGEGGEALGGGLRSQGAAFDFREESEEGVSGHRALYAVRAAC